MRFQHSVATPDPLAYWVGVLENYIPARALNYTASLLSSDSIILHVSRPRNTKAGHFKKHARHQIPEISINSNLGEERFLFTLIHEIAHWKSFEEHGRSIRSHGPEWKSCFRDLMLPLLHPEVFPDELLGPIGSHMKSPKASTIADPVLQLAFDSVEGIERTFLHQLEEGARFQIRKGRQFIKGPKKRTRYLCKDLNNKRMYLVPGSAPVVELATEKAFL